ncbi:FAD-dependent monooxygenase [Rhizobium paknamense]|uniref:Salicylate hydroxylase n=1 Tax=Rhizobium paknamense TaxID=1206817 RepID=A0ABU0IG60_9HYPH|nr:FAD-dependent monooxygenase [Rhizobium paknamense]MDQ0457258.1 salicylate hydroxylase [Rhizobium paknamense]
MTLENLAIVGAGIAGLTTALCFAQRGAASRIYEKTTQLEEVGAGLQLSPNVTRILDQLGLLEPLRAVWFEPEEVVLRSGQSLKKLAGVPVRHHAESRWGAPYAVLHRATLQRVLVKAVTHNPLCQLVLDQRVESPDAQVLRQGLTGSRPDLLVAADGVWSKLRNFVAGAPDITFSGNIAWRVTIPETDAPDFLDRRGVTAYLGPHAHVVAYPLTEAKAFNIVAIAAGVDPGEGWAARSDETQLALLDRAFSGWHKGLRQMLLTAPSPTFWPLFQAGVGRWHNDEKDLVLIGDAAHAMMPFSAQGAAMAIEDAFELAAQVCATGPTKGILAFETLRQQRLAKVRNRGALNRFAYHANGPFRLGRDLVLALRSGDSLARDLDWLYGYRAS